MSSDTELTLKKGPAKRLLTVLSEEANRARREMKIPEQPRPFFVSFLVRDQQDWKFRARFGALARDWSERQRHGFCDVRVGSYKRDQLQDGGLNDNDKSAESYSYVDLPFRGRPEGIRHGLWRLADARYREAVEAWLDKQSHAITYRDANAKLKSFQRMRGVQEVAWEALPEVNRDYWCDFVERLSSVTKRFPEIKDASVEFEANHTCTLFASSEGAARIQTQAIWSIEVYLWFLSAKGDAFPYTIKRMVTDPAELPDRKSLEKEIREAVKRLRRLAEAPLLHSYCGPVLLDPVPAGLLIHEALGHRLEGDRLLSSGEGMTFKGAEGRQVLPSFLSVYDDPTQRSFAGKSLVGHYHFDDEGVAGQDARLIEKGILKGFLTTRTCIHPKHRSNGHARGAYHRRPISRMGSLIAKCHKPLSDDELKQRFIDEIKRQDLPFGIRVIEANNGETSTDAYNFQAFLGEAGIVAKVFPDGREEWVRGLNFVGTPLNAARAILAAGSDYAVDNAFCGAESGYVPVSTVSPSILVGEMEMQGKPDSPYTPYTYPMPWEKRS